MKPRLLCTLLIYFSTLCISSNALKCAYCTGEWNSNTIRNDWCDYADQYEIQTENCEGSCRQDFVEVETMGKFAHFRSCEPGAKGKPRL